MRRSTVKRLLNLGRLLSLLGALGAVGTWAAWTYAPSWIDQLDDKFQERYTSKVQTPLHRARELLNRDPKAGIAALEQFRADFSGHPRGDHYFRERKQGLQLLANAYKARGDLSEAADCLREIVQASPRDLLAAMQMFDILANTSDRREEAIMGLENLHARIPESQFITDALSGRLAEGGEFERAWQTHLETKQSYRSSRWYIRWKRMEPHLWNRGLTSLVTPARFGNRVRLEFSMEQNIRGLRIGLPIHSNLELRKMHLTMNDGKSVVEIPLTPDLYTLSEMRQIGDAVRSYGTSSPWIEIPLDKYKLRTETHFEFSTDFRDLHAHGMRAFSATWMPQITEMLTQKNDPDGLKILAEIRQTLLTESTIDIYWHDTDQQYGSKRSKRATLVMTPVEGRRQFDITIPLNTRLSAIRLDAPDLTGLTLQFTEFSIASGDEVHHLDLGNADYFRSIKRDGDVITVTGLDPHLSIPLPASIQADSVRLRGFAQ